MDDLLRELRAAQAHIEKLENDKRYYIEMLDAKERNLELAQQKVRDLEDTIERLMRECQ